ncbi:MAG: CHAT domain-containing protein [Candidatus Obscuribacterales bacterium]
MNSKASTALSLAFSLALSAASFLALYPGAPVLARKALTIEEIEAEIARARSAGKLESKSDLLYRLGEAYFEKGQFAKAKKYIEESLAIEDRLNRKPGEADTFVGRLHTRVALAEIDIALKDFDEAGRLYKEAAAIASELGLKGEAAKLSAHLGGLDVKRGRLEEARLSFEQALNGDVETRITAYIGLSTIERTRKSYQDALKILKQAKELAGEEVDATTYGRLLFETGRVYSDMQLSEKAIEAYSQAVKELESDGELVLAARALSEVGNLHLSERRPAEALKVLEVANDVLSREKDPLSLSRCLIYLGAARAESGDFEKALLCHRQAESLSKKTGEKQDLLEAISEQGFDYFLQGNAEKGLKEFLRARKFARDNQLSDPESLGDVLRDCGMAYRSLGQIDPALQCYQEAADLYSRAGRKLKQAIMYDSIAVAYLDSNKPDDFELFHKKAADVFAGADREVDQEAASPDKKNVSTILSRTRGSLAYNYGQYCLYKSRFADAIPVYEQSLDAYKEGGDRLGQCHALRGLGLTFLLLGQAGKSRDYYGRARELADSIGNIESQWDCFTGLGKACMKLGETQEAEKNLLQAVALADRERKQYTRDTFKTANLTLREDCFRDLVSLLVKEKRNDLALEIAERGRARAFLDMLEGRGQNSLGKVALVSEDLNDDIGDSPGKETARPLQIAMAGSPLKGGGQTGFRSVSVVPRTSSLVEASAISPVNARPASMTELKSLVKASGSYIIEYLTLPDGVIIWVLNDQGDIVATQTSSISSKDLKELIRDTYTSIVSAPREMSALHELEAHRQADLRKLYDILIKPVESVLPAKPETEVTIVPHGPLFLVPFQALVSGSNKYLVEDHTLNFLPAISVLRATSEIEKEVADRPNNLLTIGNPITEANKFLGALPHSEKEAKKVASMFDASEILLGADATRERFKQLAPGRSYLHLATHGLINPDAPMESSVVLAPGSSDDGLLSVKDILGLPPLSAKLIVLSACQTGKGAITGDGVIGLSRAFIIAGTPSVMVSQWNVDDVMTEYHMGLFYKSLLTGANKSAALREAQLKTLEFMEDDGSDDEDEDQDAAKKSSSVRANPRYWAAFQLIGEYR